MSDQKLTRKDQVLDVVAHGAIIEPIPDRPGLLRLTHNGRDIPAWQTALASAKRELEAKP